MSKEKVLKIIAEAPVAFMATVDGSCPRVRPMAIQVVWDKKLYVSTFRDSRKMEQISQNPNTEIVWVDKEMRHVRIAGRVGVCGDKKLREKFFASNPILKNYFSGMGDPNYILLEIIPQKVEWMDVSSREYAEISW